MKRSTAAIITARGGSTRVPRKNVRLVCGLPVVAWNIIQAKCSPEIDAVYLTTDDDEIARIGDQYGAVVIRRPTYENSISANVPFLHALWIIEQLGYHYDNIVPILPTALLKKPSDLDDMVRYFNENNLTELTTACPVKECYIYKNTKPFQERYGNVECTIPGEPSTEMGFQGKRVITDSLWNYSRMMGCWGIATRDRLFEIWSNKNVRDIDLVTAPMDGETLLNLFKVEEWQCYDIDYPEDLIMVELLFDKFILKGRGPMVYFDYLNKAIMESNDTTLVEKYGGNFKQLGAIE